MWFLGKIFPIIVLDSGYDAVQPRALVLMLGVGEWCTRELLGIEAHRTLLRVVATDGKCTFFSFTLTVITEAIMVAEIRPVTLLDLRLG